MIAKITIYDGDTEIITAERNVMFRRRFIDGHFFRDYFVNFYYSRAETEEERKNSEFENE